MADSGLLGQTIIDELTTPQDVHTDDTGAARLKKLDPVINALQSLGSLYNKWKQCPASKNNTTNPGCWDDQGSYGEGGEQAVETTQLPQLRSGNFGFIYGAYARINQMHSAGQAMQTIASSAAGALPQYWTGKSADAATGKLSALQYSSQEYVQALESIGPQVMGLWQAMTNHVQQLADFADGGQGKSILNTVADNTGKGQDLGHEMTSAAVNSYIDQITLALRNGLYPDTSAGSVLADVGEGAAVGAVGGSFVAGVGAVPGAIIGGVTGLVGGLASNFEDPEPSSDPSNTKIDANGIRQAGQCKLDGGHGSWWSNEATNWFDIFGDNYHGVIKDFRTLITQTYQAVEQALQDFTTKTNGVASSAADPFGNLQAPGQPPATASGGDSNGAGTTGGGRSGGGTFSGGGGGATAASSFTPPPLSPSTTGATPPVGVPSVTAPSAVPGAIPGLPTAVPQGQPETVTVQSGSNKIGITSPDGQGTMKLTVDDGSGTPKTYDIDFGKGTGAMAAGALGASSMTGTAGLVGSGVPGSTGIQPPGSPGTAGLVGSGTANSSLDPTGTAGPSGQGPATTRGADSAQQIVPGPDGRAVIHDGKLTITATEPAGHNGEVQVTVDDGSGHPTTYTVDSGASGGATGGAVTQPPAGGDPSGAATVPAGAVASGVDLPGHSTAIHATLSGTIGHLTGATDPTFAGQHDVAAGTGQPGLAAAANTDVSPANAPHDVGVPMSPGSESVQAGGMPMMGGLGSGGGQGGDQERGGSHWRVQGQLFEDQDADAKGHRVIGDDKR